MKMFKVMLCELGYAGYANVRRTEEAEFKTYEEAENYAIEHDLNVALDVWYEIYEDEE